MKNRLDRINRIGGFGCDPTHPLNPSLILVPLIPEGSNVSSRWLSPPWRATPPVKNFNAKSTPAGVAPLRGGASLEIIPVVSSRCARLNHRLHKCQASGLQTGEAKSLVAREISFRANWIARTTYCLGRRSRQEAASTYARIPKELILRQAQDDGTGGGL
jgi:hypothetical protein